MATNPYIAVPLLEEDCDEQETESDASVVVRIIDDDGEKEMTGGKKRGKRRKMGEVEKILSEHSVRGSTSRGGSGSGSSSNVKQDDFHNSDDDEVFVQVEGEDHSEVVCTIIKYFDDCQHILSIVLSLSLSLSLSLCVCLSLSLSERVVSM